MNETSFRSRVVLGVLRRSGSGPLSRVKDDRWEEEPGFPSRQLNQSSDAYLLPCLIRPRGERRHLMPHEMKLRWCRSIALLAKGTDRMEGPLAAGRTTLRHAINNWGY